MKVVKLPHNTEDPFDQAGWENYQVTDIQPEDIPEPSKDFWRICSRVFPIYIFGFRLPFVPRSFKKAFMQKLRETYATQTI